jgi:hypothetical protein
LTCVWTTTKPRQSLKYSNALSVERIHRTWDVIAKDDPRWDAVYALMALDNPVPLAASELPAIMAMHAAAVRRLSALLAVDATAHDPE